MTPDQPRSLPADPRERLLDLAPSDDLATDVLAGLSRESKEIPCKYLYDARGSELFDRICELETYYPTRTELRIMDEALEEMAAMVGPGVAVVEYGSGSGLKTRRLLSALESPVAYIPIDISRSHLLDSVAELAARVPGIEVLPVCADYTMDFALPEPARTPARTVVYFPGSTIGNFEPPEAARFLARMRRIAGDDGGVLMGVDLAKDPAVLRRAYDDPEGVTAAFNRNLLIRINRELEADLDPEAFEHQAVVDPDGRRVRMLLVSRRDQEATVAGRRFRFAAGEAIHTESSYKYTAEGFAGVAATAGLRVRRIWTDPEEAFSVQYLEPDPARAGPPLSDPEAGGGASDPG